MIEDVVSTKWVPSKCVWTHGQKTITSISPPPLLCFGGHNKCDFELLTSILEAVLVVELFEMESDLPRLISRVDLLRTQRTLDDVLSGAGYQLHR